MIWSSDTKRFSDSLKNLINMTYSDVSFSDVNLGNNHRSLDYVRERVCKELKDDVYANLESIHYNYTGGTKPMAVGLYAAMQDLADICNVRIRSDISPDRLHITFEGADEESRVIDTSRLDAIELSIENLFKLHDLNLGTSSLQRENSSFDTDTESFACFLIEKNHDYMNKDRFFFAELWDRWPKESMLNKIRKALFPGIVPQESENKVKALAKDLVESVAGHVTLDLEAIDIYSRLKSVKAFVCGHWLEEYVFSALKAIRNEAGISDLAWNVEGEQKKGRAFEVDVIAMKGCKPFLFTCTTAFEIQRCKGKAFEGIYRAEQIGGQQAKSILISLAKKDTLNLIEQDMSQFDAARNFKAIGFDSIQDPGVLRSTLNNILNGDA